MRKRLIRSVCLCALIASLAGCSLQVAQQSSETGTAQDTGKQEQQPARTPIQETSPSAAPVPSAEPPEFSESPQQEAAQGHTQEAPGRQAVAEAGGSGAGTAAVPNQQPDAELVPYEGPVEHIFFHPLIVYPELAFDQDAMAQGYDDWFVTVPEFKQILEALYQKGYILISIDSLVERKVVDGKAVLTARQLLLPKGKKPLILSIDDLNYYEYMRQNGNAHKLVLDEQNKVATYSLTPQGKAEISYDNEIVPILDRFVEEHPDFSHEGAKGVIALTGYEGVLGYQTHRLDAPQYEQEKQEALRVIEQLKRTGWTFASHGYGHLDARKVSYQRLVADTERWKREVEPLLGPTHVYIYPYGSRVETGSAKHRYLIEAGFYVLCSVGPAPYRLQTADALMMDRRHIDGLAFKTQRERLLPLFDSRQIIDPVRPQ